MLLMFGLGEGSIAAAGGQIGWGKQTQAGGVSSANGTYLRVLLTCRAETWMIS
jgi:hypothetical protein